MKDLPISRRKVILVNEHDQELGACGVLEAHQGLGKLHRASSVFLFNKKNELLIQQRSVQKIVGAFQWANTCCGNVYPGESYAQCAQRRLSAELAIELVHLEKIFSFQYFAKCNEQYSEREIDTVFVGRYDGIVIPNDEEVQTTRWISLQELELLLQSDFAMYGNENVQQFVPWIHIVYRSPHWEKLLRWVQKTEPSLSYKNDLRHSFLLASS